MCQRLICLGIGYLFGCFITAEVVSRAYSGKSAVSQGSGNPGMANIASLFGVKAAAITLAGDLTKTFIPCLLCRFLFFPQLGRIAILWAGVGAVLGHDFPFWMRFKGGKGVSCTCAAIFCYAPLWGLLACIFGLVLVLITKYLPVGGVAIPAVYMVPASFYGVESFLLAAFLAALMLSRHWSPLVRACAGIEPQVDVIAIAKSKLHKQG